MLTKNQILDVIKRTLAAYKTSILDKQYATIQYVDDNVAQEPEEETLNKMLEYGLVSDALMLDDGTYLADENGKLLQI